MTDRGWVLRGPRWWLVVRMAGAIVWALVLLSDIAWTLIFGWPAGSDGPVGISRWLQLALEGVGAAAFGDWAWLAWRRLRLRDRPKPASER